MDSVHCSGTNARAASLVPTWETHTATPLCTHQFAICLFRLHTSNTSRCLMYAVSAVVDEKEDVTHIPTLTGDCVFEIHSFQLT